MKMTSANGPLVRAVITARMAIPMSHTTTTIIVCNTGRRSTRWRTMLGSWSSGLRCHSSTGRKRKNVTTMPTITANTTYTSPISPSVELCSASSSVSGMGMKYLMNSMIAAAPSTLVPSTVAAYRGHEVPHTQRSPCQNLSMTYHLSVHRGCGGELVG